MILKKALLTAGILAIGINSLYAANAKDGLKSGVQRTNVYLN